MVSALLRDDLVRQRPLKRAEYDRLVAAGVFEGERLELIHGVIVEMSPQDARHAWAIDQLNRLLSSRVGASVRVRVQLPLGLSDSEPEPDIAIVPDGDYRADHPTTALLVVEVANTRLDYDRITKAKLYAQAGVPEYWVVNLIDRRVEVHRKPDAGAYTEVSTYGGGETVSWSGITMDVDALL